MSVIPWIKDYFPNKTDYNKLKKMNVNLHSFMKKMIDKQLATYQDGHTRHFLDLYIAEMKKKEEMGEAIENGFFCTN